MVLAAQLAHEASYRVRRVVDVAEEADLRPGALFSQGDRHFQLGGVEPTKTLLSLCMAVSCA
jgi:hypothetical protein